MLLSFQLYADFIFKPVYYKLIVYNVCVSSIATLTILPSSYSIYQQNDAFQQVTFLNQDLYNIITQNCIF